MKEHSGVMEIHGVMLVKALSHPLPVVRVRGLCCTVLYCLLDFNAACSHMPIFLTLLQKDLPLIQLTVLKVNIPFPCSTLGLLTKMKYRGYLI